MGSGEGGFWKSGAAGWMVLSSVKARGGGGRQLGMKKDALVLSSRECGDVSLNFVFSFFLFLYFFPGLL